MGDKMKTRVLEVDYIVLCAGQISKRDLERAAVESGGDLASKVFTIGGACEAGELDAKRASTWELDWPSRSKMNSCARTSCIQC